MPELEKSDRHVSTKWVNVSGGKRSRCRPEQRTRFAIMLRSVRPDRSQLVHADHINPVGTINAVLVKVCVIK